MTAREVETLAAPRRPDVSIGRLLDEAAARLADAGVESPRLDAELLLADALGVDRAALLARRPEPPPDGVREVLAARLARRLAREPVAYILGRREFYGLSIEVTPAVLIPRPESELLVEGALEYLGESRPEGGRGGRAAAGRPASAGPLLADVGTGSGCLAVAIAVHAPEARLVAVDRSAAALAVARRNAARHGVQGRIDFVRGDLLGAVAGPLDAVVANLPYVAAAEVEGLMPEVRRYEPRVALDGGADGLRLIRALVDQAVSRLVPGGALLLEVAAGQAGQVAALLRATGAFSDIAARPDLAGVDRVVSGRRAAARAEAAGGTLGSSGRLWTGS